MRSTCSIYARVSKHWACQLPLAWVPLEEHARPCGLCFWLFLFLFFKWGEEVWGFFRKKKNRVLVLIAELMNTYVTHGVSKR